MGEEEGEEEDVVDIVDEEVEEDDVVVEDTAVTLGTNTTSFGLSQSCECPECPWSSCEAIVTRQLCEVKLPLSAIATSCAGQFPIFFTWIVIVVVVPETERAVRFALISAFVWLNSSWSCSFNWC
jgi:hypothetical protein